MLTLRELIKWAMSGNYDLDKPLRFQMEWTDYVKEYLPKDEIMYMPMVDMMQYDWGVIITMGKREDEVL